MKLFLQEFESPLGALHLVTDSRGAILALDFSAARLRRGLRGRCGAHNLVLEPAAHADVSQRVERYFSGELDALADVSVNVSGTSLQRDVWRLVGQVPAGRTTTYRDLARRLGQTDSRAAIEVGAAIAANPIALVVPCHRIVGSGGDVKGFAWGLDRKRWLLAHERADLGVGTSAFLPGFGH